MLLTVTSISLTRKLQFFIECHRMIYFYIVFEHKCVEILKDTGLFSFETDNLRSILAENAGTDLKEAKTQIQLLEENMWGLSNTIKHQTEL